MYWAEFQSASARDNYCQDKCTTCASRRRWEKKMILGPNCLAFKIICNMNKLRYSNSKGNIKEFKNFRIKENFPKTLNPRSKGNWLNIMLHIGYIYFVHYDKLHFFKTNNVTNKLVIAFESSDAV